ncbi:hypothetical protein EDD16DRAFT_1614457 [Pisolithus croceorrhizus]|nr:hypothetical protein EDD16DRAFT_1614457 [Pisolithus croceorrhizus]
MGVFSSKTGFDPQNDLPDLTGRVVLVTGGNRGLGYATVRHLVRKVAKVYLAARNGAKEESLTPGNGGVVRLELDLKWHEFMSKEDRLDVLIHNTAVCVSLLGL